MIYQRTQTGWFMIIIFLLIIINLTISYVMKIGNNPLSLTVYFSLTAFFILILLTFHRLKIKVDQSGIHVIYGIGLIHIKINPDKIHEISIVKTPWYYGLGIRFTGKGMLYNVQGLNAVKISYLRGKNKTVFIGSNDAIALKDFIEKKYKVTRMTY